MMDDKLRQQYQDSLAKYEERKDADVAVEEVKALTFERDETLKLLDAATARIAALEAQLREREEKLFHALTDLKSAQDGVERLMISSRAVDALNARAESAETALAAARAEIAKLKADHCSECGGDMFTRTDTGAQQCLECGTPFVPLRARPDDGRVERVARAVRLVFGGEANGEWEELSDRARELWIERCSPVLVAADGAERGGR